IFGDCVYSTQAAISLLLGYLSIFFWLNAQLPQVIENYRIGSAESLSFNFLSIWLAGKCPHHHHPPCDLANLIGCILTNQLPFQRYLSTYFVCIDICLLCQWIYYNRYTKKWKSASSLSNYKNKKTPDPLSRVFQHPSVRTPLLIEGQAVKKTLEDELASYSASSSPSKCDETIVAALLDNTLIIGRVFAWICTSLYLMSRLPQIYKNYRRKSIDGLSPTLFLCAACGNLTYASSILLNPSSSRQSLIEAIPYLIGSLGTLSFDFTIFCQFLWYWRRKQQHHHHRSAPQQLDA
ncbi:PQ loop repeat-domain-containing protein, partial [Dichotomocladium elegans]